MAGNYYYVKSPGAGSPSGGTQETGAWPAAYYASISAAITAGAGAGDFICVSDSHSATTSDITFAGPTGVGDPLIIACVSDSDCDALSTGAIQQTSGVNWYRFNGRVISIGVDYFFGDSSNTSASDSQWVFANCSLGFINDIGRSFGPGGETSYIAFYNVIFDLYGDGNRINANRGTWFEWFGGELQCSNDSTTLAMFENSIGPVVGSNWRIEGVDLSVVTGSGSYLLPGWGASTADEALHMVLRNCKIGAALTGFVEEKFTRPQMFFEAANCGASSDEAEYQYHTKRWHGEASTATNIYRNESTAFPISGDKVSLKITTDADADPGMPFICNMPTRQVDLTSASSDTLRIYLASSASLTDRDVWAEAVYRDGTNQHEPKHAYSIANAWNSQNAGTALDSDGASDWRDGGSALSGYNEYYIDVALSSGAKCVPELKLFVAKASTIIYVDTSIGAV